MPIEVKSLFVSSTSDLAQEREEIRNTIRKSNIERKILPYISDFDMQPGLSPEEHILAEIRTADLFVMILGGKHGSPYPKSDKIPPLSICEWEFEEAQKHRLEILSLEKVLPPDEIEVQQRIFRERAHQFCSGAWRKTFSSTSELADIIRQVILAFAFSDNKVSRTTELATRPILALAVIFLCSLQWLDENISHESVVNLIVVAIVAFLGFSGQNLLRS